MPNIFSLIVTASVPDISSCLRFVQTCSAGDSAAYERKASPLEDVVIVASLRTPLTKVGRGNVPGVTHVLSFSQSVTQTQFSGPNTSLKSMKSKDEPACPLDLPNLYSVQRFWTTGSVMSQA